MPIDAVDMAHVLQRIETAATSKTRCLVSTANVDFLVQSVSDPDFRETLLESDLCTADGMPIVWIARWLGLPIAGRVSGSDLLETLSADAGSKPLSVFLFGGGEGVSEAARRAINARSQRLRCVGTLNPGFGDVGDISKAHHLKAINASKADFLVASLGANKGQMWLYRNRDVVTVPIRAHLGAAVNFAAGTIRRAPRWCRRSGLEWLWRIKEEPYLWRRYARDGLVMLRLLLTRVLPLYAIIRLAGTTTKQSSAFVVELSAASGATVTLVGPAIESNVTRTIEAVERALEVSHDMVFDFAKVDRIDARFLGLILMVRKCLKANGGKLRVVNASRLVRRLFALHEADFLLRA
jgi:N-acetylglucosaminyldiphosphoundecaprenol N-acetyl-beta-D-mannosaminyltransferase